eukprot:TRINITY_DN112877_c0_g1_i1.p1 TRINITY_DN112877_c0_g1~~TRINITY_DN112877_c0_g1_i1.p1  ORF type:complete len:555 (-),score=122.15 TRINITY_DN112877_c0_g1_i1:123-1787(-)
MNFRQRRHSVTKEGLEMKLDGTEYKPKDPVAEKKKRMAHKKMLETDPDAPDTPGVMGFNMIGVKYAGYALVVVLVVWGAIATGLLFMMSYRYVFVTVEDVRQWYSLNGAAARAKVQVGRTLGAALEVRQAVRQAFCGRLIEGPTDTAGFERTIFPHVLTRRSALRSVEIGFSDRSSVLRVTRRRASDGEWRALMQSNAENCYLLGLEGCADLGAVIPARPRWWSEAYNLPESATEYTNMTDRSCNGGMLNTSTLEALRWMSKPGLREQYTDDDGMSTGTALFPTYSLLFRTGFLHDPDSGHEPVVTVGRANIELGELSGMGLTDERLGDDGRIYLCDAHGHVLVSKFPQELLTFATAEGQLRYRYAWELPGEAGTFQGKPAPWTSSLKEAFDGVQPQALHYLHEGVLVVVTPLDAPHEHFAIVVVAPERSPFTNPLLLITSIVSFLVAGAPYVTFSVIGLSIFFGKCMWMMRNPWKNMFLRVMYGEHFEKVRTKGRDQGIMRSFHDSPLLSNRRDSRMSQIFQMDHVGRGVWERLKMKMRRSYSMKQWGEEEVF